MISLNLWPRSRPWSGQEILPQVVILCSFLWISILSWPASVPVTPDQRGRIQRRKRRCAKHGRNLHFKLVQSLEAAGSEARFSRTVKRGTSHHMKVFEVGLREVGRQPGIWSVREIGRLEADCHMRKRKTSLRRSRASVAQQTPSVV